MEKTDGKLLSSQFHHSLVLFLGCINGVAYPENGTAFVSKCDRLFGGILDGNNFDLNGP